MLGLGSQTVHGTDFYTIWLPYSHFTISPFCGPEINLTCFPVDSPLIKLTIDESANLPTCTLDMHMYMQYVRCTCDTKSFLIDSFVLYNSNRFDQMRKNITTEDIGTNLPYNKKLEHSLDKGST